MKQATVNAAVAIATTLLLGCGSQSDFQSAGKIQANSQNQQQAPNMDSPQLPVTKIGPRNEYGFAKISTRKGDDYYEGIVDSNGDEVVQLSSRMLVNDITGKLALIQFERKFLFVPLEGGFVSEADLESVNGFQYAEPHQCGLAMVSIDDSRFYINSDFRKAFDSSFEFAESFHHNRALVMSNGKYRIIDTDGNTVADLDYDQVSLQSEWCWQVINKENGRFRSGFVDLNGKRITELVYDRVGYYDPEVKRIWVCQDQRYGFLDEFAKTVIPVKYDFAEVFDRGKARVVLNGRTFFIDPEGNEVPD
ncbi:MAG: WG repeat-containing protein [Pirellulaceae bacterium]|nr:WG repeat-containing protein [Pirellulaceae bacterium]